MKKLMIILLVVLSTMVNAQNQEKDELMSNTDKFSSKSGTLIQKDFLLIGKVSTIKLKVLHLTDLINNSKIGAIKMDMEVSKTYTSDTKTAVLDADEIDGLIKSITVMQEKVFISTPDVYTEVFFKSRSGFEAGCYYSDNKWNTYLKLEKYDKDSYAWLSISDFGILLSLLQEAKTKL